jgi:glyoxylase-like metal-dependent hydrolase (beta-lactamase superfamily II)
MTAVIDGINLLKIPIPNNPLGYTNIYLLRGDGNYLLVDAGFGSEEAFSAFKQQLSELNVDPGKISRIIITHSHGDHIGLAGVIRDFTGAQIAIHTIEAAYHPHGPDNPMVRGNGDWLKESGVPDEPNVGPGFPGGMRRMPSMPEADIFLEDGQMVGIGKTTLEVVWTPGHSPGHICLYDAERKLLFSADHVLPVTTPNISLRPGMKGNPLRDYLRSLHRVRELEVELVLPAHEQIFTDLRSRVDEILEHHRRRNEEIVGTLKDGPKTAYQISEQITWMPEVGGVRFHDLSHWDQRMAVSEALAHITALKEQGTIDRYIKDGIVYYMITG